MAHHLSSLGFRFSDRDELEELLVRLAETADHLPCPEGFYLRWTSESGPEMWLLCDRSRNLLGFNPHFNGAARARLKLERAFVRSERTVLDGGFGARSDSVAEAASPAGTDLVFDAPDFRLVTRLKWGADGSGVQLTAFAHKVAVFESEEDYADAVPPLEVGTLVQTGLVHTDGPAGPPQSWAVAVGTVEESGRLENPCGGEFVWTRLATDVGSLDVVADPELLPEPPAPGAILRGVFWLSGRLREYDDARGDGVSVRVFRG